MAAGHVRDTAYADYVLVLQRDQEDPKDETFDWLKCYMMRSWVFGDEPAQEVLEHLLGRAVKAAKTGEDWMIKDLVDAIGGAPVPYNVELYDIYRNVNKEVYAAVMRSLILNEKVRESERFVDAVVHALGCKSTRKEALEAAADLGIQITCGHDLWELRARLLDAVLRVPMEKGPLRGALFDAMRSLEDYVEDFKGNAKTRSIAIEILDEGRSEAPSDLMNRVYGYLSCGETLKALGKYNRRTLLTSLLGPGASLAQTTCLELYIINYPEECTMNGETNGPLDFDVASRLAAGSRLSGDLVGRIALRFHGIDPPRALWAAWDDVAAKQYPKYLKKAQCAIAADGNIQGLPLEALKECVSPSCSYFIEYAINEGMRRGKLRCCARADGVDMYTMVPPIKKAA